MSKDTWETLIHLATEARKRAYAPYSRFAVGCALEDELGRFHTGCNVENASYSLAICAERVAVGKMVSEGGHSIRKLALITSSPEPVFPCGSCLQTLREFGEPQVLTLNCQGTQQATADFIDLLPHAFSGAQLSAADTGAV